MQLSKEAVIYIGIQTVLVAAVEPALSTHVTA